MASTIPLFISIHPSTLSVTVELELSREHRAAVFSPETSKLDVVKTLSNSPNLSRICRQAVSDISSTRKRTARNNLLQKILYKFVLSQYSLETTQDLVHKRQKLQMVKERRLERVRDATRDISGGECSAPSSTSFILQNHSQNCSSNYTQNRHSESGLFDHSRSEVHMPLLCHYVGPSTYHAFAL